MRTLLKGSPGFNCLICENFLSYADDYEDDLEPSDLGICRLNNVEMASEDDCCTAFRNTLCTI